MEGQINEKTKFNLVRDWEIKNNATEKPWICVGIAVFAFYAWNVSMIVHVFYFPLLQNLYNKNDSGIIMLSSMGFTTIQISITILFYYNRIFIDMCILIWTNNCLGKYVKFGNNEIEIYDELCPMSVHVNNKYPKDSFEFKMLENHVKFLQGANVTFQSIDYLTKEMTDMILTSKIQTKPYKHVNGQYENLDSIVAFIWLNIIQQQKFNKSADKLTNYYDIVSYKTSPYFNIDLEAFYRTADKLLRNHDLQAFHEVISEFMNACAEVVQKHNDLISEQMEQKLNDLVIKNLKPNTFLDKAITAQINVGKIPAAVVLKKQLV